MTFLLPLNEKDLFFVLKVMCPQCTFSLPESGNCYFLIVQNAGLNLTFTCLGQLGRCLCSTLQNDFLEKTATYLSGAWYLFQYVAVMIVG